MSTSRKAGFKRSEKGLVTIEWVAIAAVVFIAAMAITAGVMGGADKLGGSVTTKMKTAASTI